MKKIVKSFYQLSLDELYAILQLRSEVFIIQQNCAYQDLDGIDQKSLHVYLADEKDLLAYARVYQEGEHFHIGRVLTKIRKKGYGNEVLQLAISQCPKGKEIHLEAQSYAIGYYEKNGFIVSSKEYLLDGIAHVKMMMK